MSMEQEEPGIVVRATGARTVEGVLKVVAKTGGLKMIIQGAESNWINPTDAAKKVALEKMDSLKSLVGKTVLVDLSNQGFWERLEVADTGEEDEMEVEDIPVPEQRSSPIVSTKKEEPARKPVPMGDENTIYGKLSRLKGDSKSFKVGGRDLTYLSWAEAWGLLKSQYPAAEYQVHENATGTPWFYDSSGGFVKVSVTVLALTHTVHLPIMNTQNRAIPRENITATDVNKAVQRALTKAIAMHGLGLYIYQGEDYPKTEE